MIALELIYKLPLVILSVIALVAVIWFITGWGTSSSEERANWPAGSGWDD